jgi:hypothetical protein
MSARSSAKAEALRNNKLGLDLELVVLLGSKPDNCHDANTVCCTFNGHPEGFRHWAGTTLSRGDIATFRHCNIATLAGGCHRYARHAIQRVNCLIYTSHKLLKLVT